MRRSLPGEEGVDIGCESQRFRLFPLDFIRHSDRSPQSENAQHHRTLTASRVSRARWVGRRALQED
jgi:hypothetical protein